MEEQLQQQAPQQQQQPVPQPPVDLLCPITLKLLEDPVILIDSAHTYERAAIQEWLDRGNRKDPVSGGCRKLYPDDLLTSAANGTLSRDPCACTSLYYPVCNDHY